MMNVKDKWLPTLPSSSSSLPPFAFVRASAATTTNTTNKTMSTTTTTIAKMNATTAIPNMALLLSPPPPPPPPPTIDSIPVVLSFLHPNGGYGGSLQSLQSTQSTTLDDDDHVPSSSTSDRPQERKHAQPTEQQHDNQHSEPQQQQQQEGQEEEIREIITKTNEKVSTFTQRIVENLATNQWLYSTCHDLYTQHGCVDLNVKINYGNGCFTTLLLRNDSSSTVSSSTVPSSTTSTVPSSGKVSTTTTTATTTTTPKVVQLSMTLKLKTRCSSYILSPSTTIWDQLSTTLPFHYHHSRHYRGGSGSDGGGDASFPTPQLQVASLGCKHQLINIEMDNNNNNNDYYNNNMEENVHVILLTMHNGEVGTARRLKPKQEHGKSGPEQQSCEFQNDVFSSRNDDKDGEIIKGPLQQEQQEQRLEHTCGYPFRTGMEDRQIKDHLHPTGTEDASHVDCNDTNRIKSIISSESESTIANNRRNSTSSSGNNSIRSMNNGNDKKAQKRTLNDLYSIGNGTSTCTEEHDHPIIYTQKSSSVARKKQRVQITMSESEDQQSILESLPDDDLSIHSSLSSSSEEINVDDINNPLNLHDGINRLDSCSSLPDDIRISCTVGVHPQGSPLRTSLASATQLKENLNLDKINDAHDVKETSFVASLLVSSSPTIPPLPPSPTSPVSSSSTDTEVSTQPPLLIPERLTSDEIDNDDEEIISLPPSLALPVSAIIEPYNSSNDDDDDDHDSVINECELQITPDSITTATATSTTAAATKSAQLMLGGLSNVKEVLSSSSSSLDNIPNFSALHTTTHDVSNAEKSSIHYESTSHGTSAKALIQEQSSPPPRTSTSTADNEACIAKATQLNYHQKTLYLGRFPENKRKEVLIKAKAYLKQWSLDGKPVDWVKDELVKLGLRNVRKRQSRQTRTDSSKSAIAFTDTCIIGC